MHKNPVNKQSLLYSENLNSNDLINLGKRSIYQDCISKKKTIQQTVSMDNSKTKNLIVLERVRSKLNTYTNVLKTSQKSMTQNVSPVK